MAESTFSQITELLLLLSPIKGLIAVIESDTSNATTMFNSLTDFVAELQSSTLPFKADLQRILKNRSSALFHPVLLLSCLLDPSNQGRAVENTVPDLNNTIDKALEILVADTSNDTLSLRN